MGRAKVQKKVMTEKEKTTTMASREGVRSGMAMAAAAAVARATAARGESGDGTGGLRAFDNGAGCIRVRVRVQVLTRASWRA